MSKKVLWSILVLSCWITIVYQVESSRIGDNYPDLIVFLRVIFILVLYYGIIPFIIVPFFDFLGEHVETILPAGAILVIIAGTVWISFKVIVKIIHIYRVDPLSACKWIMLICGVFGFILGSFFGNKRGNASGIRTEIFDGYSPYFLAGLVIGFISMWLTKWCCQNWIASSMPDWLNITLYSVILTFFGGIPVGYVLGCSFMIKINYNRTPNVYHTAPSSIPSTVGSIIGMFAFVFLMNRF